MRSRSSPCRPVISASAMTSAMTPTVDAERRDERDDRDERLLPLGEQVAQRDVQLEGQIHELSLLSGLPSLALALLISGNRMTSRIDGLLVSSITSRSMPTPSPAVGGRPYSSARM